MVTLHRPSNVDEPATLAALAELLHELAKPSSSCSRSTRGRARRRSGSGLADRLAPGQPRLVCLPPQPYLDTIALVAGTRGPD